MGVCGGFYPSLVITYHEGPQSLSFLSLEYSQTEIFFKIKVTQSVGPSLKFFVPCAQGDLSGDLIFSSRINLLLQAEQNLGVNLAFS